MMEHDNAIELEASAEQLDVLRELGVAEQDLQGLSVGEADALIAELQEERNAAR